jgi:hypothetical protein
MNRSGIIATVRQKLLDEFASGTTQKWADDELNILLDDCLVEVSQYSPNIVREVLVTLGDSKELDIEDVADLLWIDKVEYPVDQSPRSYCGFYPIDNKTIELDTSTTPESGASGVLAGTVTFNHGSTAVTGSGTTFTSLAAGYHIKKSTGSRWYRIASVTSATALVLDEVCRETTGADTINVTQYCTDEVAYLYCAKVHTLTDAVNTLTPALERLLVLGVAGQAAINRAQSLIDRVNIGGQGTPSQLQAWGTTQIQLYREGLHNLSRTRQSFSYPKN